MYKKTVRLDAQSIQQVAQL